MVPRGLIGAIIYMGAHDTERREPLQRLDENTSSLVLYINITSIAHRIENPLRRTSERFVKNVSWSSKINGSFSNNHVTTYDLLNDIKILQGE